MLDLTHTFPCDCFPQVEQAQPIKRARMTTDDPQQPPPTLMSNMLRRDVVPRPQEFPRPESEPKPQSLGQDEGLESALRELRSMGLPEEILHGVRQPRGFVSMPPPPPRGATGMPSTSEPQHANTAAGPSSSLSSGILASFEALLGMGGAPDGPAVLLTGILMDLQKRLVTCDARESVIEQQVMVQFHAVAAIRRLIRGIILQWRDLVVRMQGAVSDHDAALKACEARLQLAESRANAAEAAARKAESEAALAIKEISSLRGSLVQLVRVVEGQETARRRLEDAMALGGVIELSGKSQQHVGHVSEGHEEEDLVDGGGGDSDTV